VLAWNIAPIFFAARTQPVDPLLNRRVPPSPEKEKTGRDRRRIDKKELENSPAPDFFHSGPLASFFSRTLARSGRLLAPFLTVFRQPLWNNHGPQKLLDSRASLRSLLRNSTIGLNLKSLHEFLVISRQILPPTLPVLCPLEDSCKSLSVSPRPDSEHSKYLGQENLASKRSIFDIMKDPSLP